MKVIEFPGAAERAWPAVETGIRGVLAGVGAPAAMIDWVCGDLRGRWAAMQAVERFHFYVTPEVGEEINRLMGFFQGRMSHALGQMVQLELDLFCALYGGQPPKLTLPLAA
jgi:hypothetical protein